MKLPRHLRTALEAIERNEGDDFRFVLGYLNESTARTYISKLNRRGLAYLYEREVWLTQRGRIAARQADDAHT